MNYLARLGWSHGDQEIFSREDADPSTSTSATSGTAGAIFDRTKLEWLQPARGSRRAAGRAPRRAARAASSSGPGCPSRAIARWLARVVDTLESGRRTLVEMARAGARSTSRAPAATSPRRTAKFWTPQARRALRDPHRAARRRTSRWTRGARGALPRLAAELGLKLVDLAQLTRIALTGRDGEPADLRGDGASSASAETLAPAPRAGRGRARRRAGETLLLARHGQSVSNAVRRFQGAQDVAAVARSAARQAAALAARARAARVRRASTRAR